MVKTTLLGCDDGLVRSGLSEAEPSLRQEGALESDELHPIFQGLVPSNTKLHSTHDGNFQVLPISADPGLESRSFPASTSNPPAPQPLGKAGRNAGCVVHAGAQSRVTLGWSAICGSRCAGAGPRRGQTCGQQPKNVVSRPRCPTPKLVLSCTAWARQHHCRRAFPSRLPIGSCCHNSYSLFSIYLDSRKKHLFLLPPSSPPLLPLVIPSPLPVSSLRSPQPDLLF